MARAEDRRRDLADRVADGLDCDQIEFRLDTVPFKAMIRLVQQPPEPGESLRQLMQSKAPWE